MYDKAIRTYSRLVAFSLLLLFPSCDNEERYKACDCEDTLIETFDNIGGVVALTREGYKIVTVEQGIINPCESLPQSLQVDGQMVQLSGTSLPNCTLDFPGYGIAKTKIIEISDVQSAAGLYENGDLTIKIFPVAENSNGDVNEPGFGYEIFHEGKNFRISQSEIPAVSGTDPFETEADAWKVALLVAYKLNTFNDFPSVYLGELFLLRVINKQD